jgi:hypothetical protein
MTNDEARMTNEAPMSNDERSLVIGTSSFVRHSDFGIRH